MDEKELSFCCSFIRFRLMKIIRQQVHHPFSSIQTTNSIFHTKSRRLHRLFILSLYSVGPMALGLLSVFTMFSTLFFYPFVHQDMFLLRDGRQRQMSRSSSFRQIDACQEHTSVQRTRDHVNFVHREHSTPDIPEFTVINAIPIISRRLLPSVFVEAVIKSVDNG